MTETNLFSYERTIIYLIVITIIEFAIGFADFTGDGVLLIMLAVLKAVIVGAVFMHIRHDTNPRLLVFAVFIVPLLAGSILILTLIADWRGGPAAA